MDGQTNEEATDDIYRVWKERQHGHEKTVGSSTVEHWTPPTTNQRRGTNNFFEFDYTVLCE